jgi:hypothetical protein
MSGSDMGRKPQGKKLKNIPWDFAPLPVEHTAKLSIHIANNLQMDFPRI